MDIILGLGRKAHFLKHALIKGYKHTPSNRAEPRGDDAR